MKRAFLFLLMTAWSLPAAWAQSFVDRSVGIAQAQTQLMVEKLANTRAIPNSATADGSKLNFVGIKGWTSGFFSGTLWYLYELTGDSRWKAYARIWNWQLEPLRTFTEHHDIGFMVGCSFGNGYRLTGDPEYAKIIVDAARSLCTRFNGKVGAIKSWDVPDPQKYLVIIDNMMNLELLFMAYKLTGERKFYDIAVSHADITMKNHFRPDGSSYHVVEYDPTTGTITRKHTAQGHADESAWSRGQSWGLYGYTMMYRETGDDKYLRHAEKIARFMLEHRNLPEDFIFYWDFDAPEIPDTARDVSSSAIAASALIELSEYSAENGKRYLTTAEKILRGLSNPPYLAAIGENQNFILTNSVSAFRHNPATEALCYADYYFIEAILRYRNYQRNKQNCITNAKNRCK